MKYKTMEELIDLIEGPIKTEIFGVWKNNRAKFLESKGSIFNHQAWAGGYVDHVVDCMNIGRLLYRTMDDKRSLDFKLSDVMIVLFLHDIEKAYPELITEALTNCASRSTAKDIVRWRMIMDLGLYGSLSKPQMEALRYVEGEKDEYSNAKRTMSPLAAFCNMCDVASARVWFEHPVAHHDQWGWRESITEGDTLWGV